MGKLDAGRAMERFAKKSASDSEASAPRTIINANVEPEIRRKIPIAAIQRSPFQRRAGIDRAHVADLRESIKATSLNTPLVVREVADGRFELIAGENRLEAVKELQWDAVDVIIRKMSDGEAARLLTADNLGRKDLSDWEIFKHIKMLRDNGFVNNQEELGAVISRNQATVSKLMSFSIVPESLHELLDNRPDLFGADGIDGLRKAGYHESHPTLFEEAVRRLHAGSIKTQKAVVQWIRAQIDSAKTNELVQREFKVGRKRLRFVAGNGSARISCSSGLNIKKLEALIEQHAQELIDE